VRIHGRIDSEKLAKRKEEENRGGSKLNTPIRGLRIPKQKKKRDQQGRSPAVLY
jgi:hypothetical protein